MMTLSSVMIISSNMETIFERDDSIVGVNGEIIADGAHSPGFTFEEGLRFTEHYKQRKTPAPVMREIRGTYGCNMAFRTSSIGSLRFDERLPLYGWQEDLDFCGALSRLRPDCKDEPRLGSSSGHKTWQGQ